MSERINPFHDLYLTEAIGPERFVQLFSPNFVNHAHALFEAGNVVLRGLQGSGKTMLLNLLKPEIRLAYAAAGVSFPVPRELNRFISAGINLRKSGVMDFGHLVLTELSPKATHELALHFGDFLNYWIVADLLQSLSLLSNRGDNSVREEIGLCEGQQNLDEFASALASDPCWFGYLDDVRSFDKLQEKIRERIIVYRKYVNLNLKNDELPGAIVDTKTVVGLPVTRTAECLWGSGLLRPDVKLLIRIDQYEQLPSLDRTGGKFGALCQEVTHKLLAARDARVSYRLGTRQYAWPDAPRIYGTNDNLENKRDYSVLDIDDKLRRKENARTWIFPEFAEDIFKRRLSQTFYANSGTPKGPLEAVFGASLAPAERAKRYQPTPAARIASLRLDADTPDAWRHFLQTVASSDPLTAKLADAWVNQQEPTKRRLIHSPPENGKFPWNLKTYWRKERTEQALMQIASANNQQLIWCGRDDVVGLSGGNILVFLFICQHVWDAWLRDERSSDEAPAVALPRINEAVQSQGMREASEEWINKLREGEDSVRRGRFLRTLGRYFYRKLTDDRAMSYPGRNGFSVNYDELARSPDVFKFLKTCVEYGDLYDARHTSKHKGESRIKYYLAPILCPYFKTPYRHTKEPEYVTIAAVREWIEGHVSLRPTIGSEVANSAPQIGLFREGEEI